MPVLPVASRFEKEESMKTILQRCLHSIWRVAQVGFETILIVSFRKSEGSHVKCTNNASNCSIRLPCGFNIGSISTALTIPIRRTMLFKEESHDDRKVQVRSAVIFNGLGLFVTPRIS